MNQPSISVENVWKRYRKGQTGYHTLREDIYNITGRIISLGGEKKRETDAEHIWALRDVSFQIEQGERVGIIGRNGSGKTTLLRLLAGITRPTHGRISVKGRMGVLIELMAGFHPELSGRENIYLNGAIMGMSRKEIKRKFDEIVAFAELEEFIDTPIKRYSSGMHVRLGFAVAAHLDPDILLVDEVLAVGDTAFQKKCLGKMGAATQEGRTVVFVSHNMGAVANLCSKVVWLEAGRVQSIGDTPQVISAYLGSMASMGGEVTWTHLEECPGNDIVRLKAVRIKSDGVVTSDVRIDKEIVIEVDYCNLEGDNVLVSALELRDKMNAFVLASNNRASANLVPDEWCDQARPRGVFRTTCVIPANFLNDDYYSIDIGIVNQRNEWQFRRENVLYFVVHETGEMKKEYMGHWVGVVRPKLAWSTVYLGDELKSDNGQ